MSNAHKTHIADVRTVGVPVSDQDRALEFYLEKLGFEIRLDVPYAGGKRWVEIAAPGARTTIALVPARAGVPAGVETGIRLRTQDADADYAALRAGGVDADEVLRWEGAPPMSAFRDQDGNGLEIVQGD